MVGMTDVRKIVSKKVINAIKEIEGADRIELVVIGGWQVVVRKGDFKVGDEVYYFEIDAFLPQDVEQFSFLMKSGLKTVVKEDGSTVKGHVLKTAKLRGVYSQGLVISLDAFPKMIDEDVEDYFADLGVFKYEKPIPADLSGAVVGYYPEYLTPKTDSDRVQNLGDEFLSSLDPNDWVATEKVDGTSATFIKQDGKLRICSRNLEFDVDNLEDNNVYLRMAQKYDLVNLMAEGQIIKGEIYGEGIQKNPLKVKGHHLGIFESTNALGETVPLTPELESLRVKKYDFTLPKTMEETLTQVDGLKSLINPNVQSEGVVWWSKTHKLYKETGNRPNFKAINNKYLLKHG